MEDALASCRAAFSKAYLVIGYALCSASMLLLNKWALIHFPVPATLTALQCGATSLVVIVARATGALKVDPVSWKEVWNFLTVPMLFALALYSSSQLLHYADAGLQILIRTTTPVAVCIADYLFMGYELPSLRSTVALFGLVGGAVFYFRVETQITAAAIFWGAFYFFSISIEMVWVKNILNKVRMSTWTRMLITNTVTALFMAPFCFMQPERGKLIARMTGAEAPTLIGAVAVTSSCVAGVAISYFGFKLRESISATTFTFIGVVCKFATVLVNQVIWVHHGSQIGAVVLCASILLSTTYVAPRKREDAERAAQADAARGRLEQTEAAEGEDDEDAHDEKSNLVVRTAVAPAPAATGGERIGTEEERAARDATRSRG